MIKKKRWTFPCCLYFSKSYYLALWKHFIKLSCPPSSLVSYTGLDVCLWCGRGSLWRKSVWLPVALLLGTVCGRISLFIKRALVANLSDFNHEVIFLILKTSVNTILKGSFEPFWQGYESWWQIEVDNICIKMKVNSNF